MDLVDTVRSSAHRLITPLEITVSAQPSSTGRASAKPRRNSTLLRPRCSAVAEALASISSVRSTPTTVPVGADVAGGDEAVEPGAGADVDDTFVRKNVATDTVVKARAHAPSRFQACYLMFFDKVLTGVGGALAGAEITLVGDAAHAFCRRHSHSEPTARRPSAAHPSARVGERCASHVRRTLTYTPAGDPRRRDPPPPHPQLPPQLPTRRTPNTQTPRTAQVRGVRDVLRHHSVPSAVSWFRTSRTDVARHGGHLSAFKVPGGSDVGRCPKPAW
jgi:hypothetical protein